MDSMAKFVGFGEAMVRLAPLDLTNEYGRGNPSSSAKMLFSVGGDELNVMVAAAKIGVASEWVSILPTGPMGDVVANCATDAGVETGRLIRLPSEEGALIGIFFVMPSLRRVEYTRRASAFCEQTMARTRFDWDAILQDASGGRNVYVHATGITPMLGDGAYGNWTKSMVAAERCGVPVVCDLNHRPQLGTLAELWERVVPSLGAIKVLILSRGSLAGLTALFALGAPAAVEVEGGASESWEAAHAREVMTLAMIHARLAGPAVVCCFKNRDDANVQRRWSVLIDAAGTHTTQSLPTFHIAKDECGGGSAWACGIMHALSLAPGSPASRFSDGGSGGPVQIEGVTDICAAMRHADLLAALCQEVAGDHSTVTLEELSAAEARWAGVEAVFEDAHRFD